MSEPRNFHAIFCDDIRHETSGKVSLIGCYTGLMFIPIFPVTLPRLCVYINLSTQKDNPFDGIVSLSVFRDGEVLAKTEIPGEQIIKQARKNPDTPEDAQNYLLVTGFEFSPLQLERPCFLQVVAESNGEVMIGGQLRVEKTKILTS